MSNSKPLCTADSETFLLSPGCGAPPIVSWQFCIDDSAPQIIHAKDPACKRWVEYALQSCLLSLHNSSYDMCVIMAAWPDLIPLVFDCHDQDRVACTIVRQKLIEIATGRYKVLAKGRGGYTLDGVATRLKLDLQLDKNDPWRLRYGTLYNTPVEQWPEEARAYALKDATAQRAVHRAQDAYVNEIFPKFHPALGLRTGQDLLRDQFRQTRAALWLRLMELRGIRVDPQRVEEYIENTKNQLARDQAIAIEHGLVRGPQKPPGHKGAWKPFSRDIGAAQRRMVEVCRMAEEPELPITDTGLEKMKEEKLSSWQLWSKYEDYVKLDEDSCDLYGDEVLEAYQRCGTASTQLARAERLRHGTKTPIQASFQTLIDTGRTACRQGDVKPGESPPAWGAQLQNPAKDKRRKSDDLLVKGTRELFVARPGRVFCSTDYSMMELCGWAQRCITTVGFSKLAEVINAGRDPHVELGATLAGIPVAEAYARRRGERGEALKKEFNDRFRQAAKVANFGFPGGMGPAKMVLAARKQYGVLLGAEPGEIRVPFDRAKKAAKDLRDAWYATWPESRQYFARINRKLEQEGYGPEDNRRVAMMQAGSFRVRGGCFYTHAANTEFQGYCSDIFKDAGWRISREMYRTPTSPLFGSRIVNELHDEIFSELVEALAHEAAHRQAQIQIDVAKLWAPDLNWECEPALMTRWHKAAEPVYQVDGVGRYCKKTDLGARLVPWSPETDAAVKAQRQADEQTNQQRAA